MSEIAVFIKTMLREQMFLECVDSIERHLRIPYRLYVADDGPISENKRALYGAMRAAGHVVLELPADTGASAARNQLLDEMADERYILRMDDDFELTTETDMPAVKRILEERPDLGAVAGLERQAAGGKGVRAGAISGSQGRMYVRGRVLVKELIPLGRFDWEEVRGIPFAHCGFSRNLLLIRREVFEDVKWEEALPFAGEHEDFLLQLQDAGWGLAFTTASIHLHKGEVTRDREYRTRKSGLPAHYAVYRRKWGVERVALKRPLRQRIAAIPVNLKRAFLEPQLVLSVLRNRLPGFRR